MSAAPAVSVCLSVAAATTRGEVLCVVGDVQELGAWNPHAMITLIPKKKTDDGLTVWAQTVVVPGGRDIHYRFVKAYIQEGAGGRPDVVITAWESHLRPRRHQTADGIESPAGATFGIYEGEEKVGRGWLTGQMEVRLRLHSNPLRLWKTRHRGQTYSVSCSPIDLSSGEDEAEETDMEVLPESQAAVSPDEESNHDPSDVDSGLPISVSVLRDSLLEPHAQPAHGTVYEEDDYMVFTAHTFHPETQGYKFDIFLQHPSASETDTPNHLGTAYLLPQSLEDLTGTKTLPVSGRHHRPLGDLTVEYLVVRSLPPGLSDLSVTYARHWTCTRPVDVGHRGLGATYTYGPPPAGRRRCETLTENTIASFSEAQGHGAKYVEFDVHLTKDRVPVIYHDMNVGVGLNKRGSETSIPLTVPIKDLTMDQLQTLKVDHLAAKGADCGESEVEDERPFPTLRQCLDRLHPDLGFNVEIKYAMPLKDGGVEEGIENFTERNDYVDVILTEVLKHAGKRKIIFSAFDPDVCTMLRVKQSRFPVLFLCSDECAAWPVYRDVRTRETTLSAAFAASQGLLGINANLHDLLVRPKLVQAAKSLGLVVFTWTWNEETNSKQSIERVKQLNVDGVVFDKIYEMDMANLGRCRPVAESTPNTS